MGEYKEEQEEKMEKYVTPSITLSKFNGFVTLLTKRFVLFDSKVKQ